MGCKSAAVTRYEAGPRPEPCMTLALISATFEHCPASHAVVVFIKEGVDPVVHTIWNLQPSHLCHHCCVSHCIKCFCEVEREDANELIGRPEGKLIIKPQSWVRQVKCWVYIGMDNVFFKTTRENRSN